MSFNLSLVGWQRTIERLARVLRPQVETVAVTLYGSAIDIQGAATSARIELGIETDNLTYMVPSGRSGGGGPPPSLEFCDLWGRDVIEVGRLAHVALFALRGLRIYREPVPCRVCNGVGKASNGDKCGTCGGNGIAPSPDDVPWLPLPGWDTVDPGGERWLLATWLRDRAGDDRSDDDVGSEP
jgi:hypothetical protein